MARRTGVYLTVQQYMDEHCSTRCPALQRGSCWLDWKQVIECMLDTAILDEEEREEQRERMKAAYRSGMYYYSRRRRATSEPHYSETVPELKHIYDDKYRR